MRRPDAAASRRGARPRQALAGLAVALVLGALFVAAIIAAIVGSLSSAQGSSATLSCSPSALGRAQIATQDMPTYEHAAARFQLGEYGVWVLAGIHSVETNFGRNVKPSSAGALGPMQFMPATWQRGAPTNALRLVVPPIDDPALGYATDGDGDGLADIHNVQDSVHAAARYLQANGAPADWRRAIFAYNHAGWYVDMVVQAAEQVRGQCTTVAAPGAAAMPVGDIAGSPKNIVDTVVLPLSNAMGVPRTVAENDAANAAHGPTKDGGLSDHQGPPTVRWAADMSNGAGPTPEMDRLAQALADRFGFAWQGAGVVTVARGGYRYQLIYRSNVGGNHFDHVHFGIELAGAR